MTNQREKKDIFQCIGYFLECGMASTLAQYKYIFPGDELVELEYKYRINNHPYYEDNQWLQGGAGL